MDKSSPHKLALIGHPVSQSLSPLLHNHWLSRLGISGTYEAIDVLPENLRSICEKLKNEGFGGWNITLPHKEAMFTLVDKLDSAAQKIGAVNTVINDSDNLVGHNTDARGFMKQLNISTPNWRKDKPALVLGAGGASRAVVYGLLKAGVEGVLVCNRTQEKANELATDFTGVEALDWDERSGAAAEVGLIVNTTSLGMDNMPPLDMSVNLAAPDTVVYDIIYKPLMTDLLNAAADRGLAVVDGLGMLYYQAAAAFELWTGKQPPSDGLYEQLRSAYL